MKLERLDYRINEWDVDLKAYVKTLEKTKPVIITGRHVLFEIPLWMI